MKSAHILITLILSFGLFSCGNQSAREEQENQVMSDKKIDYGSFVSVGGIDPAMAGHVVALLDANGIPNLVEGSVVYGVSVGPSDREKAIALLQIDSKKEEYLFNPTP
ncbi:hypothetical protein OAE56_01615 [Verrucomicrobiales bacterium]|nr:hypothetical protein [Verrucomicrobiales bacterium]